jgi:hypothetical protein
LLVHGLVTAEKPDLEKEVCDYDGSKPYYKALAGRYSKATGAIEGMETSLFPLREMHDKIAAGCGKSIEFDDDAKTIHVTALVVDKSSADKVRKGVLIGFSQGGDYIGTPVKDPVFKGCIRYIADPREISLVDAPCLPQALLDQMTEKTFQFENAEGSMELRKFHVPEVKKLNLEKLAKAAKAQLKKGMYSVQELARLVDSLKWIQSDALYEADYEGDASAMPEALGSLLRDAIACFMQMAEEETQELLAGIASLGGKSMTPEEIKALEAKLQKSADRLAKAKASMKALHDHMSKGMEMCKALMGDDSDEDDKKKVDEPPVQKSADQIAAEAAAAAELAKAAKPRSEEELQTLIADGVAKALAKQKDDDAAAKVKLVLAPRPGEELAKVATRAPDTSDAKNAVGF